MRVIVLLVAVLLIAVAPVGVSADTTTVLFNETFDSAASLNNFDTLNANYTLLTWESGVAKQDASSTYAYGMKTKDGAVSNPGLIGAGSQLILTAKIYDSLTTTDAYGQLLLADSSSSNDYFGIVINRSDYYSYRTKANSWVTTSIARTAGWHDLMIVVNPFTGSNDISFYIDGALAGSGSRTSDISMMQIRMGAAPYTANPNQLFYYDDVSLKMNTVPEPGSIAVLAVGLSAFAGRRFRLRKK